MKRHLTALVFIFSSAILISAQAQSMKPGLWEIENKLSSQDSQMARQMEQMRKQLAALPPEQRKMMEDMMAKHAGAAMPTMTKDGMKVTMCMSPEMVARNELPVQQTGNCTHKRLPQAGDTIKMTFTCTEPPASGEGTVHLQGDSAYSMDMQMTSSLSGKREATAMHSDGKWISSDCGKLRPAPVPARNK